MASEKLEIDMEVMQTQAQAVSDAVEAYKKFGENPFDEEVASLEDMNTDFIAKYKVMLGDLNDGNSKVIETLEEIADLTKQILDNFEKVDAEAVASMGYNREE